MEDGKGLNKEEPSNSSKMGRGYNSYGEAAANRRSDETTILDMTNGKYYNIKIFQKPKSRFLRGF